MSPYPWRRFRRTPPSRFIGETDEEEEEEEEEEEAQKEDDTEEDILCMCDLCVDMLLIRAIQQGIRYL